MEERKMAAMVWLFFSRELRWLLLIVYQETTPYTNWRLVMALRHAWIFSLSALAHGCGDGGSGSTASSPAPAVADGSYDLSAPTCAATNVAPTYESPAAPAALRDFAELTSHQATLKAGVLTETVSDADCSLTATQSVYKNEGTTLQLKQTMAYAFTPAGCGFVVTVGGTSIPVDASFGGGQVFAGSASTDPGATLTIAITGDASSVTSQPLGGLGCGDTGQFRWTWTKAVK
jgi:hypothetical protein